jgi:hypothetical protein
MWHIVLLLGAQCVLLTQRTKGCRVESSGQQWKVWKCFVPEKCCIDEHVLQKWEMQARNKAYTVCKTGNLCLYVTWTSWLMILLRFFRNMPERDNIHDHFALLIVELSKFPYWMLCSGYHTFVFFRCQLRLWFVIFLSSLKWWTMNVFVIIWKHLEASYDVIVWYNAIIWHEIKKYMGLH